jgi:Raf kinase inhibitor-like YbhB/YbcL family protein
MNISSPAFQDGEQIPPQYSRNGDDKSPPLTFHDVPPNAQSLLLIVDDPDAPRGLFTHWTVFDIDPRTEEIGENQVPVNAREGSNDWKQPAYGGPQPPSGEHRYFFKLFALDTRLNLPRGARRAAIQQAMEGHVLAQAQMIGRFSAEQSRMATVS